MPCPRNLIRELYPDADIIGPVDRKGKIFTYAWWPLHSNQGPKILLIITDENSKEQAWEKWWKHEQSVMLRKFIE